MSKIVSFITIPVLAIALVVLADAPQAQAQGGISIQFGGFGTGIGYRSGYPSYGRSVSGRSVYGSSVYGHGSRSFNNGHAAFGPVVGPTYGSYYRSGYSGYRSGYPSYRSGYRGYTQPHLDYHPAQIVPHNGHYHYQPGHYDVHYGSHRYRH